MGEFMEEMREKGERMRREERAREREKTKEIRCVSPRGLVGSGKGGTVH